MKAKSSASAVSTPQILVTVGRGSTSAVTVPERLLNAFSCPSSAIISLQMFVKLGRGLVGAVSFPRRVG